MSTTDYKRLLSVVRVTVTIDGALVGEREAVLPSWASDYVASCALVQVEDPDLDGAADQYDAVERVRTTGASRELLIDDWCKSTLGAFVEANETVSGDPAVVESLLALDVGEEYRGGGGAASEWTVRRTK